MTVPAQELSSLWMRTVEPLLWLGGAGHETRSGIDYRFDCAKRTEVPHYVLQFTLAGTGFYERAGRRVLLPAGTAFLDQIPGPFLYGYAGESRWPYEQVFVSFTGDAAFAGCRQITGLFGHVLTLAPRSSVETLMLAIAHQSAAGTLRNRYTVSSLLYELLMTLLSALQSSRIAATGRISMAMQLIDLHASNPNFNATELARLLACSREHLSRQFVQATGATINDYLVQHRLRIAALELRSNDWKLDLVARQCGFSSANYLCRVFRKRFGVSPADFRRSPWMVAR